MRGGRKCVLEADPQPTGKTPMDSIKTARTFLGLNAAFSLVLGVDLALAPGMAAGLLFDTAAPWQTITLRVLGIGLILFGLELLMMVRNRFLTRGQVLFITAMDAGWVLGSALLLSLFDSLFTGAAVASVILVALAVAV